MRPWLRSSAKIIMANTTTDLPIESSDDLLDDAIRSLVTLEQIFRDSHDRRAIKQGRATTSTRSLARMEADLRKRPDLAFAVQ